MSNNFSSFKIKNKVNNMTRCGAILFNQDMNKIILVENNYLYKEKNISVWGLPKGILESNETFNECAMREIYEETGIKISLRRNIPYIKMNGNYYFPIKIDDNEIYKLESRDKKEIRGVRWFSIKNNKIDESIKLNKDLKSFINNYLYRAKNLANAFDVYKKKNNQVFKN